VSAAHRPWRIHPASVPHHAAHFSPRSSAPAMLRHICFAQCLVRDRAERCYCCDPGSTACLSRKILGTRDVEEPNNRDAMRRLVSNLGFAKRLSSVNRKMGKEIFWPSSATRSSDLRSHDMNWWARLALVAQ
jgi:hypothetical protein